MTFDHYPATTTHRHTPHYNSCYRPPSSPTLPPPHCPHRRPSLPPLLSSLSKMPPPSISCTIITATTITTHTATRHHHTLSPTRTHSSLTHFTPHTPLTHPANNRARSYVAHSGISSVPVSSPPYPTRYSSSTSFPSSTHSSCVDCRPCAVDGSGCRPTAYCGGSWM